MFRLKNNILFTFICLIFIGVTLFFVDLFFGSVNIPFNEIIEIITSGESEKSSWNIIILQSRLPKALTAVVCGAGLSVCGLIMQTLFKNPLAGPYILGVSSGAGLGVAVLLMGLSIFGLELTIIGSLGINVFAILGAFVVMSILIVAAYKLKDIMTVLILGVMLGSVCTAIIGVIQFFSNSYKLKQFILWSLGDLSSVSMQELAFLTPIVVIGIIITFFIAKNLNLYLLGENYAKTLGLNINNTRIIVVVITAILVGTITAYCGPIGFIGIVVPHISRLILNKYDHKILIPFSALIGINIMLLSDVISHLPGTDKILPINSVTALIGIPFIFWIIFNNKRISKGL